MIRIVLVDDHALAREGLRATIAAEGELQLVGVADDLGGAPRLLQAERPDVVLLRVDSSAPEALAPLRALVRDAPEVRVLLLLSMRATEELVVEALAAGALGCVCKRQPPGEVVEAIRLAAQGCASVPPPLAPARVRELVRLRREGRPPPSPLDPLSPRERQVLDLMLRGLMNDAIGERLDISRRTVETHRAHILKKLRVHSLRELFVLGARLGLLTGPGPENAPAPPLPRPLPVRRTERPPTWAEPGAPHASAGGPRPALEEAAEERRSADFRRLYELMVEVGRLKERRAWTPEAYERVLHQAAEAAAGYRGMLQYFEAQGPFVQES